jgi:hypothetical protein
MYKRDEKMQVNKHMETENFILTLMYTWLMGCVWYTSDFDIVTIDVKTFALLWHQYFYPGIEDICVRCKQRGGDSWLCVSIFWKSLHSYMVLKGSEVMEVTEPHTANWT